MIEDYYPKIYDIYHFTDGKHSKEDIYIYEDDSILEVYYKISSQEKITQEYIHIWYFDENNKYNLLGYKYEEIESLKDLYSLKDDEYISESVDDDGEQIINVKNYDIHKTLENIVIKDNRIYYTTLNDYLSYSKINPKTITKDKWSEKISYLHFINGIIRIYWPELTEYLINDQKNKLLAKRVKRLTKIVKNTDEILNKFYSFKDIIKPSNIYISNLILDNKITNENTVNIAQIFTDMKLGKYKEYVLLFSKLMIDSYEDSHYKVLKSVIKDKNYPENPLSEGEFVRLTKGTIISLQDLKLRYLDIRRSVSLVFYKDHLFIHLNINDKGVIKLIIQSFIVDDINQQEIIKDMNSYIDDKIISQKIYFGLNGETKLLSESFNDIFKNPISILNYDLEYDIKNFDIKVLEKMIDNLSIFFRIENISDSKIHIIYKRVNEYNSISGKLRMISKIVKYTEKKEEIVSKIADIFNILDEDALENYEIWTHMSKKGYKTYQEGIELIIEGFKSSHIRVNIGGCSSKREMTRINHLINVLMKCYYEYIEHKKDKLSLMKKKKIDEELLDFSDDEILEHQQEALEHQQGEVPDDQQSELSKEKSVEDDEDSGSSESIEMGLLDELDSDEDESFGGYSNEIKGGGYDLRSYYLNRLSKNAKYDNELFKFTTGKSHHSKKGELKGTYARSCSANYSRHPIALTEKELNEIKDNPDYGEGIGYSNAIKIDGRPTTINGDIYYICPKYWDVKNETPLDPLKLDDFRENVYGMDYSKNPSGDPIKTTSKDKANSDKYVLVRSGYHWTNAGDDIMRYKVESMKNVHPDGFDLPCCNVERLEKISKNDKIEWYNEKEKKWMKGVCISSGSDKDDSKPYTLNIDILGEIKAPRKLIKRYKVNNHISNSQPCNEGKYCHINDTLKQYIGQHLEMPKKGENDRGIYKLGLVRKGIKKGGDSLLYTLCELLNKKDINTLISDIIKDLHKCDNLYKIANGSFVNTFYSDLNIIENSDVQDYVKYLVNQKGIVSRHRDMLFKNNNKINNLFRGTPLMVSLNNHYYRLYSSIINYEKYLRDNTDKDDRYITSVLCSIMNIKDNITFGDVLTDTCILVLDGINTEIQIREPIGGFKKEFNKLFLIYKYRDSYEPIFLNIFENNYPLIDPYNISSIYEKTINTKINNQFESIQDFLKNIINNIKILLIDGRKKEYKQIPGGLEMIEILKKVNMPIISCIYDDYGFVRYIETRDNCLIPIKPSSLEIFKDIKSKYILLVKERVSYDIANNILKIIDKEINKDLYLGYLDNIHVNVIEYYEKVKVKDKIISKHGFYIKEIVVNETSFIPVNKILYDKRLHHDILYKGELYEIDSYISKNVKMIDKMQERLIIKDYKDEIYHLLSRNIYILYLKDKTLQKYIEEIKSLRFMRNYHKVKKIYNIINKYIKLICIFKDEEYDTSLNVVTNDKINIYNIENLSNDNLYYKIMMKISSLFINYSKRDYNRLISGYINEEILAKSIQDEELYFNFRDIESYEYKYLFSNKSIFVRKVNIFNDNITNEQYEKIKKLRDIKYSNVEFEKKYPKIINEYIHKNALILKYNKLSKYDIIQLGLEEQDKIDELKNKIEELIHKNEIKEWITDEKEMSLLELFRGFLGNKINDKNDILEIIKTNKITIPEAYLISHILKKGINVMIYNKDSTIELMIIITPSCLNSKLEETEMISLIQSNELGYISIRNELLFMLDSFSKKYYNILRKQHRVIYDSLKANTTSVKK